MTCTDFTTRPKDKCHFGALWYDHKARHLGRTQPEVDAPAHNWDNHPCPYWITSGGMRLDPAHISWSLAENALGLCEQSLPLCSLAVHGAEARDIELLSRQLHGIDPFLQRARCKVLLAHSRLCLAHNLAALVPRQLILGQATTSLLFGPAENDRTSHLSPRYLALFHLHRLHRLHGFHVLDGLHRLHGLRRRSTPPRCLHGEHGSVSEVCRPKQELE